MKFPLTTINGKGPARLANAFSDLINAALRAGVETDVAVCVAAQVIADYARMEYGDDYLDALAQVIRTRRGATTPIDIGPITS